MPCYHPITGWRTIKGTVVFGLAGPDTTTERLQVPCGQCIGCRLERSRQWAIRCVHEATLHKENAFITLTYDQEHLPPDGGLVKKHWQNFAKAVRRHLDDETKQTNTHRRTFRYFHCGEYGDEYGRPHYHAAIFGIDFSGDRKIWQVRNNQELYVSPLLEKLWGRGFCTVGELTFDSAAYVARYVMKKINGPKAEEHYQRINKKTGETWTVQPEYTTMSRNKGIGHGWIEKYNTEVRESDAVLMNGKELKPPIFYDKHYEINDPHGYEKMKENRKRKAIKNKENYTPKKLHIKEKITQIKMKQLVRQLE